MPKILYFVTEDWFFVSHFLPMARTAAAMGFEVLVATRVSDHAERIRAEGFRLIQVRSERKNLGLISNVRLVIDAYALVRNEKPDVVHCIALRSVAVGAVAAKFAGVRTILIAPTGLGYLWLQKGLFFSIVRSFLRVLIGVWLRGPSVRYIFENTEDPLEFRLGVGDTDVTIVGGAGVDPRDFSVTPEPPTPPLRIAVVSRMIRSKGIEEAVAALHRARALGANVELSLIGDPDPSNRSSLAEAELERYASQEGVHWHGSVKDVARVWREHHIALLLSHREGLPRSLVEAAAAGRPIVTTDVVGCREIVRDQIEGFLVPRGDTERAAKALVLLAADVPLRARMGAAAHARYQERFSETKVASAVGALYRSILNRRVLHAYKVFAPDIIGGIPEVIASLARGMALRYNISVLVARSRGWGRRYNWDGVAVEALPSLGTVVSSPVAPAFPFILASRSRHADLVAFHHPSPLNDIGAVIGLPRKAALVVHWHSEIIGRKVLAGLVEPFVRFTLSRAQRIIVAHPSLLLASPFLKAHIEKCAIIPFGVDLNYWNGLIALSTRKLRHSVLNIPALS